MEIIDFEAERHARTPAYQNFKTGAQAIDDIAANYAAEDFDAVWQALLRLMRTLPPKSK